MGFAWRGRSATFSFALHVRNGCTSRARRRSPARGCNAESCDSTGLDRMMWPAGLTAPLPPTSPGPRPELRKGALRGLRERRSGQRIRRGPGVTARRPQIELATAFGYGLLQRDALRRFLDDGRLRLETNDAERALRSFVAAGRKAWRFFGSDDHAHAAANLFSLIASAVARRFHRSGTWHVELGGTPTLSFEDNRARNHQAKGGAGPTRDQRDRTPPWMMGSARSHSVRSVACARERASEQ